jgi:hypothetical protein
MSRLYAHRFLLSILLAAILFIMGYVIWLKPQAMTSKEATRTRNLLQHRLNTFKLKAKQNKLNDRPKPVIIKKPFSEAMIFQSLYQNGLQIKAWTSANHLRASYNNILFDVQLSGHVAHWSRWFQAWQSRQLPAFITSLQLEKHNNDIVDGRLQIALFLNNSFPKTFKQENVAWHIFSPLKRSSKINSLNALRMTGLLEKEHILMALLEWPDGRMLTIKKGERCCLEEAEVVALSLHGIQFVQPNGRRVVLRH